MLRVDKPSCGNEILHSWQMAVFPAQALLGLNRFEHLHSGSEETLLGGPHSTGNVQEH